MNTVYIDNKKMLKKTVLIICSIGIIFAITIIIRYLNPSTTKLSTDIDQIQNTTTKIQTEVIATGLNNPTAMAFTSPDRIIFTEKNGTIRQIEKGFMKEIPLTEISNIYKNKEEGLIGLTLDPEYTNNKYVYVCYAFIDSDTMFARVSRWIDQGDKMTDEKIILDKLPAAPGHAGCGIAFGPDQKLYITVGDALEGEKAQYPDYLNGKILRINSDGSNPTDNPYAKSAVRSIGHRNSLGMDRDSKGNMYASEQGPSIFDGQPGGDEINRIIKRGNYGRNKISHEQSTTGFINPIAIYTPAIDPAGLHLYKGAMFSERKDNILLAMIGGKGLLRLEIDKYNPDHIVQQDLIIDQTFGKIKYVTEGPDGSIYIMTNNIDRQGSVQDDNDKIVKIYKR